MYLHIVSGCLTITAASEGNHGNQPSGYDNPLRFIWEVTLELSFAALLAWLEAGASDLLITASDTAIVRKFGE